MSEFKNIKYKSDGFLVNVDMSRFNDQYEQAQKFLDSEVIRCSSPFVPMDTGALMRSAITGTVIGSGEVVWDCVYARKCYYGDDTNFRTDKHPNAQARWFEAAKAAYKDVWVRKAKRIAGGG